MPLHVKITAMLEHYKIKVMHQLYKEIFEVCLLEKNSVHCSSICILSGSSPSLPLSLFLFHSSSSSSSPSLSTLEHEKVYYIKYVHATKNLPTILKRYKRKKNSMQINRRFFFWIRFILCINRRKCNNVNCNEKKKDTLTALGYPTLIWR